MMLQRTKIFDLNFINDTNFDALIDSVLHFSEIWDPEANSLPFLFTPNVDDVVKLHEKRYAALAALLKRSYYILPDGQPVIWASRLLGKKRRLQKRLPGSELFPLLWKALIGRNKRIMIVAPSEAVGELLRKEYPSACCYVPPFFDADDNEALARIQAEASEIFVREKPEYVFLGIRFPKQNYIALGLAGHPAQKDNKALFLLMGASYEFYLQLKKRAPQFWQKLGLEWFYRFTQEPGRLFRRYFIDDMKFFGILAAEFFRRDDAT